MLTQERVAYWKSKLPLSDIDGVLQELHTLRTRYAGFQQGAPRVLRAIEDGKIYGSTWTDSCGSGCFYGHLCNLDSDVAYYTNNAVVRYMDAYITTPIEKMLWNIVPGATPHRTVVLAFVYEALLSYMDTVVETSQV